MKRLISNNIIAVYSIAAQTNLNDSKVLYVGLVPALKGIVNVVLKAVKFNGSNSYAQS